MRSIDLLKKSAKVKNPGQTITAVGVFGQEKVPPNVHSQRSETHVVILNVKVQRRRERGKNHGTNVVSSLQRVLTLFTLNVFVSINFGLYSDTSFDYVTEGTVSSL